MTLETMAGILEQSGMPVSYQEFPDEECPRMPYITFEDTGTRNFMADGIVYATILRIQVILWTAEKNLQAEKSLEMALENNGITWDKQVTENEQEACINATYEFDIIGG